MNAIVPNDSLGNSPWSFGVGDLTTQYYVYWHFVELELLGANQTSEFNIFVPGYITLGPIKPKFKQVTTIASPRLSPKGGRPLYFTLNKTSESTHYPILNGLEMYTVLELHDSPTNQEDGIFISIS